MLSEVGALPTKEVIWGGERVLVHSGGVFYMIYVLQSCKQVTQCRSDKSKHAGVRWDRVTLYVLSVSHFEHQQAVTGTYASTPQAHCVRHCGRHSLLLVTALHTHTTTTPF